MEQMLDGTRLNFYLNNLHMGKGKPTFRDCDGRATSLHLHNVPMVGDRSMLEQHMKSNVNNDYTTLASQ